MITKRGIYAFFFLLALAACAGVLIWLLGTSAGARWIGGFLAHRAALEIEVRKVEGSIWEGLLIEDLKLKRALIQIGIKNVHVRWQPLMLLGGQTKVRELLIQGMTIRDDRLEKMEPPDLSWPRMSLFIASLKGSIESLTAKDIVYSRLSKQPITIDSLSCRIAWQDGGIDVSNLIVHTEQAGLRGELGAGFRKPFLKANLSADMLQAAGGMKKVSLQARLTAAASPEQLAGNVTIVGISALNVQSELTGEIGLTGSSLNLRKLNLKQSRLPGNINGEGEISFPQGDPLLRLHAQVRHLDLGPETHAKTDLNGSISLTGDLDMFSGRFSLANAGKGLASASLAGSFQGGKKGISLHSLSGLWLGGGVDGGLEITWGETITARADLHARNLNPSLINPDWSGVVNMDLSMELQGTTTSHLSGYVNGRLLASRLHNQALTGEVKAQLSAGNLIIAGLDLHGRGFDIHADGDLKERIAYRADIRDLSGLIPETRGRLQLHGWVRLHNGIAELAAKGNGRSLSAGEVSIDTLNIDMLFGAPRDRNPIPANGISGLTKLFSAGKMQEIISNLLTSNIELKGVKYGRFQLASATVAAQGDAASHTLVADLRSSRAEVKLSCSGAYQSGSWQGKITALSGTDKTAGRFRLQSPADLRLTEAGISLSPLLLQGSAAESLSLAANVERHPWKGNLQAEWKSINLGRINGWITEPALAGHSSGNMSVLWMSGVLKQVTASLEASGTASAGKKSVPVSRATAKLDWGDHGLLARAQLVLADKGRFEGEFSSSSTIPLARPESGKIQANWQGIDAALFQDWFPRGGSLKGRISGQVEGRLLPGDHLDLNGRSEISEGLIGWQGEKGQFSAKLKSTVLSVNWQGEAVKGNIDLALTDYGQAQAVFQLPIPARIPTSIARGGTLAVSLKGQSQETGLLTSLFPGIIEESRGQLGFAVDVGGTWEKPLIGGHAEITGAVAYLPAAGIRLQNLSLKAHLEGEKAYIDSLKVASGPGSLELQSVITFRDWKPVEYSGTLTGTGFQAVYLPELRMLANPKLNFNGTEKKLFLRGEIVIPELTAQGGQGPAVLMPSKDVIIVDSPRPEGWQFPLALDLRIRLTLGEKVLARAEGADVQLAGGIDLTAENLENIRGKGVLTIVKGKYSAFDVNLDITRGRLIFDGPAGSPNLDILAVRRVENQTVGVLVTGKLPAPVIKLYANPLMADPDIMAYLVLGRALRGGTQELSLVVKTASLLLPKSAAASLQDQLMRRLGLDTLEIGVEKETGGVSKRGATGLTKGGGTGGVDAAGMGGIAQSVVTIGKYLTPKIYVSFGRSLFSKANLLRLRYKFSPHWELETQSGTESGADIFYKIEFR